MPLPARADEWYRAATSVHTDWALDRLVDLKHERDVRVSVVIPARDEEATIADVVGGVRQALVEDVELVDELIVMDSDSTDRTASIAAEHGATVFATRDVAPVEGSRRGKGEALWKSLFVSLGDVLVFVDADLTLWGPHFVTGLLGPLLAGDGVELVKGFYDRLLDGSTSGVGGRVTELTARPYLNVMVPELAGVVQPLAGEWAIRRSLFERLAVPAGYGVEIATLLDTLRLRGLDAIAQVDLGRRGHVHQHDHDLGVMAAEVLTAATRRLGPPPQGEALFQYRRDVAGGWVERPLPGDERAPAIDSPSYVGGIP